ncbi:protein kinase domain containing protein, partial [Acanthamoeba castellanii str. Neff]
CSTRRAQVRRNAKSRSVLSRRCTMQQQQQAKQGPGDQQQAPSPIDQVIADWQKTLTASASTVAASAMGGGSPDSPAPSPLFGPNETHTKKKKDDKQHPKNKREGDPLICLSVPSDDCTGKTKEEEQQLQEGKLIILDDYDNGKQHKKTHSRHNSATPPAPADSAEAASDLTGLLLPPLRSSSSTPTSATTPTATPLSPTASSSTPPAASAPAGVTSPASSSQPQPQPQPQQYQQQQQQQQGGGYGQPSQFIPQQQQQAYGGGYGGSSSGTGSGPAPGSFHPPAYQNVGPGGAPYGTPIYNGPAYGGGGGGYPPQQQQQQYGFPPGPGQGYPGMYQQPPPQQQGGPMGYAPQAPLQQQMNAPMGYNQPRPMGTPMGLSAPYQGAAAGGAPMGMASPLPASAPEALADQLSNLHVARQNFMQQQPPQHGLMQPLVPVAAPMISSPDNTGASGAAAGGGSGSGVDDEWHIEYNELETNKEIARGSFGVVYQGAFRGTEVAVKKLIQQHFSPEQMKDFLDEINMMKKLHHPNVVLLIGVCVKEPNLCIVTELLAGSMWNLLHDKSVRLDWKLQHKLLLDTAKGMNYLHLFKPPIIHRDLKSPNLLVDSHFNVKIADFGLARIKAQLMTGNLGTCQYMAPEVITSATYSEKADVYSYGVVIWEVLTRQAPWQGMQPMQIAYGVVHQSMRPPIPPGTAPPLVHLMQQCWHQDPAQRPSFTEILQQLKALHV